MFTFLRGVLRFYRAGWRRKLPQSRCERWTLSVKAYRLCQLPRRGSWQLPVSRAKPPPFGGGGFAKQRRRGFSPQTGSPSQALPRQLPQRCESIVEKRKDKWRQQRDKWNVWKNSLNSIAPSVSAMITDFLEGKATLKQQQLSQIYRRWTDYGLSVGSKKAAVYAKSDL